MTIWIDAQLSPLLAKWIAHTMGVPTQSVRDLGLREAGDFSIFHAARKANAIVLTKDADFPHLLQQHGAPPKVLWLTCGNTSNQNVRRILLSTLEEALRILESGESIVEITGPTSASTATNQPRGRS
jgi:predicted nuclease of predicted toxin-antitoxin system